MNIGINKIVFELFSGSRREGKRQTWGGTYKGHSKFDLKYM